MTKADLFNILAHSPLVASVQADPGTPLDSPETLLACAKASISQGVGLLRLQGSANIKVIRSATGLPVIGLIKRENAGSDVYITPTLTEVDELLATGCEIIATDASLRPRPGGADIAEILAKVKSAGILAMADCDSLESVREAVALGFDIIGTTLSGYTQASPAASGPDFELLREATSIADLVLAEGRYQEPWQVQAALNIGAKGVVVGGALNDPIKQTRRFLRSARQVTEPVVGIDLGGTWLRAGLFDLEGKLVDCRRIPLPAAHSERLDFIRSFAGETGARHIGVSAGGTINPHTNVVIEAKGFIPDYVGQSFNIEGFAVRALNDGLATAWGHACHPRYAGKKVATLALGTGVGAGVVERGRIVTDRFGSYPRLNDLPTENGYTVESSLGGLGLGTEPSVDQIRMALSAADTAFKALLTHYPDVFVVCGGVGLSHWFRAAPQHWLGLNIEFSPYGADAGLYGAAHLVLHPPDNFDE